MPSRNPRRKIPRRKPAQTRLSRTERRAARAKRFGFPSYYRFRLSGVSGFLWALSPGDTVSLIEPVSAVVVRKGRSRDQDVFERITKLVIAHKDALGRTFVLKGVTRRQLRLMIVEEERRGAVFMPQPSLDQRRLLAKEDEAE